MSFSCDGWYETPSVKTSVRSDTDTAVPPVADSSASLGAAQPARAEAETAVAARRMRRFILEVLSEARTGVGIEGVYVIWRDSCLTDDLRNHEAGQSESPARWAAPLLTRGLCAAAWIRHGEREAQKRSGSPGAVAMQPSPPRLRGPMKQRLESHPDCRDGRSSRNGVVASDSGRTAASRVVRDDVRCTTARCSSALGGSGRMLSVYSNAPSPAPTCPRGSCPGGG
jgi:hypothetical protein